jgi:hypothetical protein
LTESILAKIRKLLELASNERNPSRHEAESAMAKVQELLAKHDLELADIEASGRQTPQEEIGTLPGKRYRRLDPQDKLIFDILARYFQVRLLYEPSGYESFDTDNGRFCRRVLFVGKQTHVLIARYVYGFLSGEFERQWKSFAEATGKTRSSQRDFFTGLYHDLRDTLEREKKTRLETLTPDQKEGLAKLDRDEDLMAWIRDKFPEVRSTRPGLFAWPQDAESYQSGRRAGRNIHIRPAIRRGTAGPKALPEKS